MNNVNIKRSTLISQIILWFCLKEIASNSILCTNKLIIENSDLLIIIIIITKYSGKIIYSTLKDVPIVSVVVHTYNFNYLEAELGGQQF